MSELMISDPQAGEKLLAWFDSNQRRLPWRSSKDPYRIWVSEVMLQQTQVDRVIPFFEAFILKFPEVGDLARAPLDEVLAAWSGLGYYRRARHLHAAARQIVARGDFPGRYEEWCELPGIGPYTGAAIASIALGVPRPVLDANVERVVTRILALEEDPKKASIRRQLLECADALLSRDRPGDSNQALMELGATVCRPKTPRCTACPLASACGARLEGNPELYPVRRKAARRVVERRLVIVARVEERVLLFRRSSEAETLASLWELPWIPWSSKREAELGLGKKYGGRWALVERCGKVRHAITFRDIRLDVWRAEVSESGRVGESAERKWYLAADLEAVPTSSLVEKVLEVVRGDN